MKLFKIIFSFSNVEFFVLMDFKLWKYTRTSDFFHKKIKFLILLEDINVK